MIQPAAHESPIVLTLPVGADLSAGLLAVLADHEIQHVHFPPPWGLGSSGLDGGGIDLAPALPDVRTVDEQNLARVVNAALRLCDQEALDRLVARTWLLADKHVRAYYLQRSVLGSVAATFRLQRQSLDFDPPPSFRRDRILEHVFAISYRLQRGDGTYEPTAPAEEGTLSFHPYDAEGTAAREDLGLPADGGPLIELYAYSTARARHLALAERVAAAQPGWRVIDGAEGPAA